MVSALDCGSSGPGSLCCFLRQDTLLCTNGYHAGGKPCDGLASHPGVVAKVLAASR